MSNNLSDNGKTQSPFYRGPGQFRPNRDEAIWLACLVDTEGSIGLIKHGKNSPLVEPKIRIHMATRPLIEKAQEIIFKVTRRKPRIMESRRPQSRHMVYGVEVTRQLDSAKLCEFMLPYLIAKKALAEIIIKFSHTRKEAKESGRNGFTLRGQPRYGEAEAILVRAAEEAQKLVYTTPLEGLETERQAPNVA